MTRQELAAYLEMVRAQHDRPDYLPRHFMSHEEWNRLAPDEHYRRHGVFREMYPDLGEILKHKRVVILGEPGAGKTYVASAAVLHVADAEPSDRAPVHVHLAGYRGNLVELLNQAVPDRQILAERSVDEQSLVRVYIFDGLDEVPGEQVESAVHDIERLFEDDQEARLVLTCRQAFFEGNRNRFTTSLLEFHILDFTDEDIRTYLETRAVGYEPFMEEARRVKFEDEISNPFILTTAVEYFLAQGRLGQRRSDIVSYVIERLVARQPQFAAHRQRRALRMLGIAMEVYCRSVLTVDEAKRVLLQAMRIDANEADALLEDLTHSILVITSSGISFQMRSHGEYLAAEELADSRLERVLDLVHLEGTRIPNESWVNTVSYLVELHADVRRYFLRQHPRWVLQASPTAFSAEDRRQVVIGLSEELVHQRMYLLQHPLVNHRALARHLVDQNIQTLLQDYRSGDPVRAANALVLLAHGQVRDCLDYAVDLALDRSINPFFRRSAIFAVANLGNSELIPRLRDGTDKADPLRLSIVDCIGALVDEGTVATVLPILQQTDALVSSAFFRFRELRSREALVAVLDFLIANPRAISGRRIDNYVGPVWNLLARFWDAEIAQRLGRLLAVWERSGIYESTIENISKVVEIIADHDVGGTVSMTCLQKVLAHGGTLAHFVNTLGRIITCDTARWLMEEEPRPGFISRLAFHSRQEIREILVPVTPEIAQEQRAYAERLQRAQEEEAAAVQRLRDKEQHTIAHSKRFAEVLQGFRELGSSHWPELPEQRKEWLRVEVSQQLEGLDCLRSIHWENDRSWSVPVYLETLLTLISHYKLRLENDVALVQSLIGWTAEPHIIYYNHFELSEPAKEEFDRLLADTSQPAGAVHHLLGFLERTAYVSGSVVESLVMITDSNQRPADLRGRALRILVLKGVTDELLLEIAKRNNPPLANVALDELIRRQHRPTIERRLADVLQNDDAIRAGEVEFPEDSPFGWFLRIRTVEVWDRLVTLRRRALELRLPCVTDQVTNLLARIDMRRLPDVIREQLPAAPPEWQDYQRIRAVEYERDARLQAAQQTTLDEVQRRLTRDTTMRRFKVWCEGPSDIPVYDALMQKLAGTDTTEIVTQDVGGWPNVLSPDRDLSRMWEGCRDLLVIMDGDKGRDMSDPNRPLSKNGCDLEGRLAAVGIKLRVLHRYGIENYFSQRAMEAVLERDLSAFFLLSEDQRVDQQIPQYSKRLNREVARRMDLANLRGTDLGDILEEIRQSARL